MKNLVNIQTELKVPKGNYNSFAKFRYRSTEDILEELKPLLFKYEATLIISDDLVQVGEKIFLKATATLTIGEQSILAHGFAETGEHKGMSSEQQTGCASSYARKYALNGLFLIDETEADADSQPKQKVEQKPMSVDSIINKIIAIKKEITELGGKVEADDFPSMNRDELTDICGCPAYLAGLKPLSFMRW